MSAVASEGATSGKRKSAVAEGKAKAAEAAQAEPVEAPGPQIESQRDRFETVLEYEPDTKLPVPVVLVWICALIGLGAYCVTLYFPDLALWRGP